MAASKRWHGENDNEPSRSRQRGRLPPFVPLLNSTLDSPAWTAASHGAKALYVELKRKYRHESHNNGYLFLPQRQAERRLHSHHEQIGRWFRELQHFGFIRMTEPGSLGVEGKGKAPHWRLTELGYKRDLPTRDFEKWNGAPFVDSKTESRGGKPPHHRGGKPPR
jgi:hypothetical protein